MSGSEEDKLKFELVKSGLDRYKEIREKSYDYRDDFAKENTIKYAELLIGLNIGLIGAMSFILNGSQTKLAPLSSILSSLLVCSVISILYSLGFRNRVIEANLKHQQLIGEKSQEAIEKISEILKKHTNNFKSLIYELENLTSHMNNEYESLGKELLKKEIEIKKQINRSELWFSISATAIIGIIILESGFLNSIYQIVNEILHILLQ